MVDLRTRDMTFCVAHAQARARGTARVASAVVCNSGAWRRAGGPLAQCRCAAARKRALSLQDAKMRPRSARHDTRREGVRVLYLRRGARLAASRAAPVRHSAETGVELAKCKDAAAQRGMAAAVSATRPSVLLVLLSFAHCTFATASSASRSSPCAHCDAAAVSRSNFRVVGTAPQRFRTLDLT